MTTTTPTRPRRPALTRKRIRGLARLKNELALFLQRPGRRSDLSAALTYIDRIVAHDRARHNGTTTPKDTPCTQVNT